MINVQPNDVIVFRGDSLGDFTNNDGGVPWFVPLVNEMRAYYRGASPPSSAGYGAGALGVPPSVADYDRGMPRIVNTSHAGDTTTTLVGNLASTVYAYSPHIVIYQLGVNDGNVLTNAETDGNIPNIINGTRANCPRLRGILWVGPLCCRERLPFGIDAWPTSFDLDNGTGAGAGLVGKDAVLRSRASSLSFDLLQFRDGTGTNGGNGLWRDYELVNNGGNAPSGILTNDGRHLTAAGRAFMSAQARTFLNFTG